MQKRGGVEKSQEDDTDLSHDCLALIDAELASITPVKATPINDPGTRNLFIDGSRFYVDGKPCTGGTGLRYISGHKERGITQPHISSRS